MEAPRWIQCKGLVHDDGRWDYIYSTVLDLESSSGTYLTCEMHCIWARSIHNGLYRYESNINCRTSTPASHQRSPKSEVCESESQGYLASLLQPALRMNDQALLFFANFLPSFRQIRGKRWPAEGCCTSYICSHLNSMRWRRGANLYSALDVCDCLARLL